MITFGGMARATLVAAALASSAVAGERTVPQVLWDEEGAALRALADTARGADRAEALLRLGEWERDSAQRLRVAHEADGKPAADVDVRIDAHLSRAEEALSAAVPIASPDRLPQVLFALGDLRRFRGDAKGAAAPLERLVKEFASHPLAVDAAVALGDDLFDDGKLAVAMAHYEFAASGAPTPGAKAYARYKLAWCHMNLEEFAKARELFVDVVALASAEGRSLSLADEARRDFVLGLARDASVPGPKARALIERHVPAPKTRKYTEGYAKLISASGRDKEAFSILLGLEAGATSVDAVRLFGAELEIATRRRDLPSAIRAADRLAAVVEMDRSLEDAAAEVGERTLRVAAVTLHGEGRASGDARLLDSALALYDAYFRAFDRREWAYELHHHAGELLLSRRQPALAERHYTAAVVRDLARLGEGRPAGRWLEKAAHGAVLAAQDALPRQKLPDRPPAPTDEEVDREPPAPTPLDEAEKVFVAACDRYLKALPRGAEAVNVAYQRAVVFYRHHEFQSAGDALAALALQNPASDIAEYAAQLALDALRHRGEYDRLAELAAEFRKRPPLEAKMGEELAEVRQAAFLAAAAREARKGRHAVAATRYLTFVETFPTSPRLDRALYNAAAALTEAGRFDQAIGTRAKLLEKLPRSSLVPRARERQLADLVKLGRFAEAQRLAAHVADDTKGKDAVTRLHDAIVLADAAGNTAGADALRESYLKKHPRGPDAIAHALALADRRRGCSPGRRALQKALSVVPDLGWRAVVLARLARHEARCDEAWASKRWAGEAAALAGRLPAERADALDASAEAALLLAEPVLEKYRREKLRPPYEKTIPRKLAALKAADEKLAKIIERGRAGPAVCALASSGLAYAELARGLSQAKAPRSFTEEQRMLFEEELANKAQPLFDRAKTSLMESVARAREAGVAPGCLAQARDALAELWPERFGQRLEAIVRLAPDTREQLESAHAVLAKNPDAPAGWLLAARAELAAGRPAAALVLAERVKEGDPLRAEALEVRAWALDALGRAEAALATWRRLATDFPARPLARRILADRALSGRDLEGAKEQLEHLRKVDDRDFAVAVDLGVVLRGLGDAAAAEKVTRAAAELAPERGEPSLNLGLLLCGEGGRPKEGLAALEHFLERGGRPPDQRGFDAALAACRALAKGGNE